MRKEKRMMLWAIIVLAVLVFTILTAVFAHDLGSATTGCHTSSIITLTLV